MGVITVIIYVFFKYKFATVFWGVVISIFVYFLSKKRLVLRFFILSVIACGVIFSLFFSEWISNTLIYRYGTEAEAVVTRVLAVEGQASDKYDIVILTENKNVADTYSGNHKPVFYPQIDSSFLATELAVGMRFTVKYLKGRPESIIILTDKDDQFGNWIRCGLLERELNDARERYAFATGNRQYRLDYADALESYHLKSKCGQIEAELKNYFEDQVKGLRK